jgi:hypothetical protein
VKKSVIGEEVNCVSHSTCNPQVAAGGCGFQKPRAAGTGSSTSFCHLLIMHDSSLLWRCSHYFRKRLALEGVDPLTLRRSDGMLLFVVPVPAQLLDASYSLIHSIHDGYVLKGKSTEQLAQVRRRPLRVRMLYSRGLPPPRQTSVRLLPSLPQPQCVLLSNLGYPLKTSVQTAQGQQNFSAH